MTIGVREQSYCCTEQLVLSKQEEEGTGCVERLFTACLKAKRQPTPRQIRRTKNLLNGRSCEYATSDARARGSIR